MTKCLPEEMLSASLDGDLKAIEAQRVEAHLAECDTCRAARDGLRALRVGLAGLADVEPSRDMWAEISVRHNQDRRPRLRWAWLGVAAAAAAAILLILVPGEPEGTGDREIQRAYASVVAAERTYIESIAALEDAVGDQAVATLNPEARAAVEQGLAQIDDTIRQCRKALDAVPNDLGAHRMLLAAYQRKVDLLTELVDQSL
jgi:predicted anti-sigma-YlaC factor YlaD